MHRLTTLAVLGGLALAPRGPLRAIPNLQLYFDPALNPGAHYDATEAGWVTAANPSIISALMQGLDSGHTFRLIVSLPEAPAATDPNPLISLGVSEPSAEGSLTSPGAWTFGNPGLPPHDVFDAWYTYFDFTFVSPANSFAVFDVQSPGGTTAGFRDDFRIEATGPGSATSYHFDLVDLTLGQRSNGLYVKFAPPSHDALMGPCTDCPPPDVPEPATAALLACGLAGLGLAARRRSQARSA